MPTLPGDVQASVGHETYSKAKRRRRRRQGYGTNRCRGSWILTQLVCWRKFWTYLMLIVLARDIQGSTDEHGSSNINSSGSGKSKRFGDVDGTFYDVLGVSQRSSQAEIKRVFRRLAVKMHPDKLGPFEDEEEESKANDMFVRILKAYETLGDPALRRQYDESGMEKGTVESVVANDIGPMYEDSPFGLFVRFGSGRGGMWLRYKGHGQRIAPNIVIPHQISFEEAFSGVTFNVTVTRDRLCKTCGATGSSKPGDMPTCPLCQGKGYAYHLFGVHESSPAETETGIDRDVHGRCSGGLDGKSSEHSGGLHRKGRSMLPGYAHAVNTTCKVCEGMGKLSDGLCPDCEGKKVKLETETMEVTIPPGAGSGHTITLGGKAHQHPRKIAGAVNVVAVLLPHPRFDRQGANLVYQAKISLIDALVGFERKLTLLNGTRVPVVHDQVTLSGYSQEVPGLGFPVTGKDGEYGALVINLEVEFPPRLTAEHLEVLRGVLSEAEIKVLEDVLRLMRGSKDHDEYPMDPLELVYSQHTSARDGERDSVCIPDLLWWSRPWPGVANAVDDDDDGFADLFRQSSSSDDYGEDSNKYSRI